jgi:uncharacterized protein (TIGR02147 family)
MSNGYSIPSIQGSKTFDQYLKAVLNTFKMALSPESFLGKLRQMGITSRVTYRKIVANKRALSWEKLLLVEDALDLSWSERQALRKLYRSEDTEPRPGSIYQTTAPHVLSDPINTIVLSLCSLPHKTDESLIGTSLSHLFSGAEIAQSLDLLMRNELIVKDSDGFFSRKANATLSTLPGVKAEHSRRYMALSRDLAGKAYDLPLSLREYTAFSARIKQKDLPKLKDLVREFRNSVYRLDEGDSDTVIHASLDCFVVSSVDEKSERVL